VNKTNEEAETETGKKWNKNEHTSGHYLGKSASSWLLNTKSKKKSVISGFNGQNPCDRKTLSILESFLHILKA